MPGYVIRVIADLNQFNLAVDEAWKDRINGSRRNDSRSIRNYLDPVNYVGGIFLSFVFPLIDSPKKDEYESS